MYLAGFPVLKVGLVCVACSARPLPTATRTRRRATATARRCRSAAQLGAVPLADTPLGDARRAPPAARYDHNEHAGTSRSPKKRRREAEPQCWQGTRKMSDTSAPSDVSQFPAVGSARRPVSCQMIAPSDALRVLGAQQLPQCANRRSAPRRSALQRPCGPGDTARVPLAAPARCGQR